MLPITLRRLEVFVAVVEARGFSAAAAALNITQPSVSVHMRALETKVGAALFERQPGVSPQLTDAGRRLYGYAQETLERANAMSAELGQSRRKLRFAAQRFVTNSLLANTFGTLSTTFPDIEVILRTGTFEEVHSLFQSGAVDLVFMLSAGHELPEWHTGTMGRYRLALIASPDHPLARQQRISSRTLAGYPFISAYRGSYFGRTIDSLVRSAGISTPLIAAQSEEASTVRDMVMAGMGIAFTLRRSVQREIAAGTIVELDVDMDPLYLVLSYARNPKAGMPEIDSLIEMVRRSENLTQQAGERAW
ncbi:MAG: LysR family transcriptional regulator [Pseudomonadota bacterium]